MSDTLKTLQTILEPEPLDDGLFRGQCLDLGFGHLFGGQVLGQALAAASRTVPTERGVHSFHSYFLRAGDLSRPVIYDVENLRDGGSFSTRRVSAIQQGRPIFFMTASYQQAEVGFEHQDPMPAAPAPETLPDQHQLAAKLAGRVPPQLLQRFFDNAAVDMRLVDGDDPFRPDVTEPRRRVWMRASGVLEGDAALHRHLLAYASDFNLLITALQPHGVTWLDPRLKAATIDHAMWFHRPFRFDEWLLYVIDSPNAVGGRGLVKGQFFNQDGQLVASAMQEGLIRHG